MPDLYTAHTEEEIRARFVQKCNELISHGLADTYKEICENTQIPIAAFNQVKSKGAMPTFKMIYNLQAVYKVSAESILFEQPPQIDLVLLKEQLATIHEALDQIDNTLLS